MTAIKPRDYQIEFVNSIIKKLSEGHTRVCCQLATGAGKTICFSYLLQRYLSRYPSAKIAILVHRQELMMQTKKTLSIFGIENVYVEMVETFNNKLKKVPDIYFDLIILDETHIGNFFKLIDHFIERERAGQKATIILGFSATPKSSSKKHPLNGYYQAIVTGVEINKLIELQHLSPAIHHAPPTQLNSKNIKVTAGEYNMAAMGIEFSKPKLVDAVVDAYEKFCKGKKTLVFNTTIEHSNLVHECFKNNGYNSRSLDSKSVTDEVRKETFEWLSNTPNAILNNVGIATTGFDDPTIEAIIFNRKTKSLPLWLQCCGRGSRLSPQTGKEYFIIIDLGDNIRGEKFGYWNEKHDWKGYFYNPDKPGEGAPPMKVCPNEKVPTIDTQTGKEILVPCEALIYMAATICPYCGFEMPRQTVYSDMIMELEILPDTPIRKNSQTFLHSLIKQITERIKPLQLTTNEKKEMMFYAFKEAHEKTGFEPKQHILSHLVSVYGK